jgi:hypothetical protein
MRDTASLVALLPKKLSAESQLSAKSWLVAVSYWHLAADIRLVLLHTPFFA